MHQTISLFSRNLYIPNDRFDPVLTYGRLKHPRIEPFRPRYVLYDRMILTFQGFFRQKVLESATVQSRVRYVNVMYFMEDDSITIMEPRIPVKHIYMFPFRSIMTKSHFNIFYFRIVAFLKDESFDAHAYQRIIEAILSHGKI